MPGCNRVRAWSEVEPQVFYFPNERKEEERVSAY